jgi:guanylate kinase
MKSGPLIIVSGPAGSGKSTLIQRVLRESKHPLRLSVSATTRAPRPGEREDVDYHFWSRERFEKELEEGGFLEHAVVHGQNYYGTPRSEVASWREKGFGVILDIDVQGAEQVRAVDPEAVSIFIQLPRWEMYEQRLRVRGSETEASIARRLQTARRELERMGEYNYVIVNDDVETATREFLGVIERLFSTDSGA